MHYISTRNTSDKSKNFAEILIEGLASNGGLYVPKNIPQFSQSQIQQLRSANYQQLAFEVTYPFIGNCIPPKIYQKIIQKAYSQFHHKDITPLKQINPQLWGLELFHGPTLAFKDIALSLLGELFEYQCQQQKQKVTIIGSTSGDTGPAAMSAFAGRKHADIFMLFPYGRTSDIQRKQMTTLTQKNTHPIAIKGTFDDCQDIAKAIFSHQKLKHLQISAVNSINWARIIAQITYYAFASLKIATTQNPLEIVVPTGNFGNILAAYCAKKMQFPINTLIIASNENDILTRFFNDNDMTLKNVKPTLSPSMDIQVSGNFERMLFWLLNNDPQKCSQLMQDFRKNNTLKVPQDIWKKAQAEFKAYRINDQQTLNTIKLLYQNTGEIYDPHSAIAVNAAQQFQSDNPNNNNPIIAALTAHPAKFPEATQKACGQIAPLPEHLKHLNQNKEHYTIMENDPDQVADFIEKFSQP